jgi:F-type H+-transporting ATPase subunit a
MLFSPLEQFNFILYKPISYLVVLLYENTSKIAGGPKFARGYYIFNFDLSISNHTIYVLFALTILFTLFRFTVLERPTLIPNNWQLIVEGFYSFILEIVKQQAGFKAIKYVPIFVFVFLFLLLSNLVGLVPFSFTTTSHIIQNFTLSFSFFIGFTLLAIYKLKAKFISLFIPSGVPVVLLPLLFVIELISYISRPFSLAIRLFANMLAGHTLLHILASFVFSLGKLQLVLFVLPLAFTLAIIVLELGIAFLQAYVFVTLLAIYLKDALYAH